MKANIEQKYQELQENNPKQTTEASLGNLYDMNKQLMMNEKMITHEQIKQKEKELQAWAFNRIEQGYFMLLCHEQRDYTLFNLTATYKDEKAKCAEFAWDVIDCLGNRGEVLAIEEQEDGAWECWIRVDDECYAYYLFPYGAAVLSY